jgi:DNA topoisomerase VI subunit A
MKTVFVINEETGKVVGTMQVDQRADEVIYVEMEEIEGGLVTTVVTFDIRLVPIGDAMACVVLVPDQELAESLTLSEDVQFIN